MVTRLTAIAGKASKVGGFGQHYNFSDPLADNGDASKPLDGSVARLSMIGRGHSYGHSISDPGGQGEGRGKYAPGKARKVSGGAKVKGGVF